MQGQYDDGITGLYYNRYRYYDPKIGTFISHDPIGLTGGENLYAFGANILSYIDPLGLDVQANRIAGRVAEDFLNPDISWVSW